MSNSAKNPITHPPANSLPIGKSVSAPATVPMAPRTVTPSGVKPIRRAPLASGALSRANAARVRKGALLIGAAPSHRFVPRKQEVPPLHRRRRDS